MIKELHSRATAAIQGGSEVTRCRVPATRRSGGFRSQCIVFSACAVIGLFATVAEAGSGTSAVNVTILDDTPSGVVLAYSFGDFSQTAVPIDGRDYVQIALGSESRISEAGAPDLPQVCRSIIIPDDAAVAVNVVSAAFYEVENTDVAPSKGHLYRDIDPESVPYTFGEAYKVNADYPGELVALGEPYILRNYRGVVVRVNPFQYNPVARTLRVYTSLTVEIAARGPGRVNVLPPAAREPEVSHAFHQLYRHHFLNAPPDVRYDPIDETGGMLIICYDAWMPNVQPLVEHKNSIGIDTTMVGVSEIGNNPALIKSYIQEVYDAGHLTFVLLVGDAAQVATPYAWAGSADPTYALLAGSDHYPDIFVGRFSAENAAQVDTQVGRTITYETLPATQQDWFWRGIGIGSDQGAGQGDDGESDHQHIANIRLDLLDYGYTHVDGFYGYSATAAQVANAVNDGRGIINYCGHGSTYSWATSGFSNANVDALVNDNMLPFIVSVACVNGQFAGYTCFAEAWLRATHGTAPSGAIGMYASSVNQYWAPPMCAQDETVDLLCAEAYFSFGALCFAGACRMLDEYGQAGIETFDTWHVFGDPSVRVNDTAEPPGRGDLDGDGDVDLQDLAILLANYGSDVPPGEGGDLDGDGDVDLVDLSALLANYGYGM
jgi:hypothetical protein